MLETKPKQASDREYYLFAFRIIGDFGATIALPVVVFVLIGQYFDKKYSCSPWLTILGFVVAALLTAKIILRKAKKYGQEYENLGKKEKEKN